MSESPFIKGTSIQYAWDSTSLGWFKECPRKYQYHMVEGWKGRGESIHLRFGRLYHAALEQYDHLIAVGADHEDALRKVLDEVLQDTWEPEQPPSEYAPEGKQAGPWVTDHPNKTRETLIRSVIWYLEHFKNDPAKTIILENGKPAVELSFRMEFDYGDSGHEYLLCGHLDRVVDFAGDQYVMDRKTTTHTISSNYFDQYSPDNQMSLYTLASKVIYKAPVKGVIVDAVQVAVGFSRFARGFAHRTDTQLDEWLRDLRRWLNLAREYAETGNWPQNDKSCHNYGGCPFRMVCGKSPEVRQKFLSAGFVRNPWNPLEPR